MVGWYHRFSGHELGQTPGDGEGQGSLADCSPWGLEESDTTWRRNNNKQSGSVGSESSGGVNFALDFQESSKHLELRIAMNLKRVS